MCQMAVLMLSHEWPSRRHDMTRGCMHAGYESDGEEGEGADDEEKPVAPARPPRKVLEPYEVPTSGAFWMHDDRGGDEEVEEG